ncbi:hypothetical protein QUF64_10635 [Anaerolineales bacterium HSG6]|nr:hypothetical protein [Anaerolineales bacterium HSG6]MDM8529740.1 hypothetical protein [Anaerolineales bacterium HSG25]
MKNKKNKKKFLVATISFVILHTTIFLKLLWQQEYTVELVAHRIDTGTTTQKQSFTDSSVLEFSLQFGSGPNYLQFNIVENSKFQASQSLQILLHQIRIQTPPSE